ncbi:MAG: hypothetical protein MUF49_24765 [Oculatellaceae cyanobacterium Prado106]|jgi:hypothetical protein|nr:hypothetical protein [Oculatellaceae cyanobacterium Prado106]
MALQIGILYSAADQQQVELAIAANWISRSMNRDRNSLSNKRSPYPGNRPGWWANLECSDRLIF